MTDTATPVPEQQKCIAGCGRLSMMPHSEYCLHCAVGVSSVSTEPPAENPGELRDPTEADLADPMFEAVWQAIKGWDLCRYHGSGYAGATGTDVMTILAAIRPLTRGVVGDPSQPSPECSGSDKPNAVSPVPDELVLSLRLIAPILRSRDFPNAAQLCEIAADALEAQRRKIAQLEEWGEFLQKQAIDGRLLLRARE